MKNPETKDKPVAPVTPTPSTRASNPKKIRDERPPAGSQTVRTPDGGNTGAGGGDHGSGHP
jgi:hypothetical protein